MKPAKRAAANRVAAVSAGRAVLFAGTILAVLVSPIGLVGHGDRVAVKSAFATHDNANDRGKGHGGGSGGTGNPGGRDDDDDEGHDGGASKISGERGGGNTGDEAAEAEDAAFGESVQAVESSRQPADDNTAAGLPTIREVFALSDDAVVGPDEEQALIAAGWNAR